MPFGRLQPREYSRNTNQQTNLTNEQANQPLQPNKKKNVSALACDITTNNRLNLHYSMRRGQQSDLENNQNKKKVEE